MKTIGKENVLRRVAIITLLILILCCGGLSLGAASAAEEDPHIGYSGELEKIVYSEDMSEYKWGTWSYDAESLTGTHLEAADRFYISNIRVPAGKDFVFTADVTISGEAAGLVFGIPNQADPGRAWYCMNVDYSRGNTRVFAVGTGSIGTGNENLTKSLTTAQQNESTHNFRVECFGGTVSSYLDGEYVGSDYDSTLNGGGYLGFMVWNASVTFNNAYYKILARDTTAISNVSLEGIDFNYKNTVFSYDVTAPSENESTTVSVTTDYDAYINGVKGASRSVSLDKKRNFIFIEIKQGETTMAAVPIIVRREILSNYDETYRSYFHFSPNSGWLNDPNGFVYDSYNGVYHIFWQRSEKYTDDGKRSWGHAVSEDLVHFEQKTDAVLPDDYGQMWSGSAVIDYNNTSGLFDDSVPAGSRMVLLYSPTHTEGKQTSVGTRRIEQQSIAYTLDGGETWIKYNDGAPVISNTDYQYGEMRDAKGLWVEDSSHVNGGYWMMITAGYTNLKIFTSDNLIDWKFNSVVKTASGIKVTGECVDIFKLPVDDDPDNTKWVLTVGGREYMLGQLVNVCGNVVFRAETEVIELLTTYEYRIAAGNSYAAIGFYNEKKGRWIVGAWMCDYTGTLYDDKEWNGYIGLLSELSLKTVNGKIEVCYSPIEELDALHDETLVDIEKQSVAYGEDVFGDVNAREFDMNLELKLDYASKISLRFAASDDEYILLTYDKTTEELVADVSHLKYVVNGHSVLKMKGPLDNGVLKLRIFLDRANLEIYADQGEEFLQILVFPEISSDGISLTANGLFTANRITLYTMKNMWRE